MTTDFKRVRTPDELARFLGYPGYRQLKGVVYSAEPRYREFEIPKKGGGVRRILAPEPRLRRIQRNLAAALAEAYKPPKAVHGFVPKKSIATNADAHVGAGVVFNLDLEDFFPSIKFHHVVRVFRTGRLHFPEPVATVLAQICCHEKSLPQGAPTSPIVSNMVCRDMDRDINLLAIKQRCAYTRYADDLTFSHAGRLADFPVEIAEIVDGNAHAGRGLSAIIGRYEFKLNQRKIRIADRSARMEVTGLTVNVRRNVRRRYIRQVDAMLHAWETYDLAGAQREFDEKYDQRRGGSGRAKAFDRVVAGKLAFLLSVRGVDDPIYDRLARRFNDLVGPGVALIPLAVRDALLGASDEEFRFYTAYDSYRYVGLLGSGGCGTVVKVVDGTGREHAVKYLSPETVSRVKRKRFKNELAFCEQTTHPRIVHASDRGLAEISGKKCPFYVMPRYRESLAQTMKRGIGAKRVLPLFVQIIEGVQAVHALGVVHRDLKPENILLSEDGAPVIADFGIADFAPSLMRTIVKTAHGERVANWGYAAPEQRERGLTVGEKADVYALGMMLNEVFTGRKPFGLEPMKIGDAAPGFAILDPFVFTMIRQNPDERPSLDEVAEFVRDAITHEQGDSPTE